MNKPNFTLVGCVGILFLFILVSPVAEAANQHMLILGGAGDPGYDPKYRYHNTVDGTDQDTDCDDCEDTRSTIFDDAYSNLGSYLQQSHGWQSDVRFDGGHPASEAILKFKFSSSDSRGSFSADSYKSAINDYITKIQNGQIKPGDQLFIYIDSHGAAKGDGEQTHHISANGAAKNLNSLDGSDLVSIDDLEPLKELAEAKGIKLAIADMSCHSGNSLALADDKTCVLSASSADNYAYSDFSDLFTKNLQRGGSLESIFLKTRSQQASADYPMISSPAGRALNENVYPGLARFLYSKSKDGTDKLTAYLLSAAESCQNQVDDPMQAFAFLKNIQESLKDTTNTSNLVNLLANYKQKQDQMITLLQGFGARHMNDKYSFHVACSYTGYDGKLVNCDANANYSALELFNLIKYPYLDQELTRDKLAIADKKKSLSDEKIALDAKHDFALKNNFAQYDADLELMRQVKQAQDALKAGHGKESYSFHVSIPYQDSNGNAQLAVRDMQYSSDELSEVDCTSQTAEFNQEKAGMVNLENKFIAEDNQRLKTDFDSGLLGLEARVNLLEQVKASQADFAKQYPDFDKLSEKAAQFSSDIGDTDSLAENIAKAERGLYQNLYADYAKDNTQPNPCRDFTFPKGSIAPNSSKVGKHRHASHRQ